MKIKKIEKFEADPKKGHEVHDTIREGRAVNIDPLKISAVLEELKEKINEVVDFLNK